MADACPQPNRSGRGNSDQYGRSNFAQNLKHETSPTVTMSTMLSALKIIIHSGIWLAKPFLTYSCVALEFSWEKAFS
jgi:hypothetical protein